MNAKITSKRTRGRIRRRKMLMQKFFGFILIALSVLVVCIAAGGGTPEESDATAVLMLAPMGLYLLFTKECVIY